MRWTVLFATVGMLAHSGRAQFFTHYGPADGLRDPNVTCLVKGSDGYLWVGTQEGLYRYDGGHFKAYHYTPGDSTSIPHDHVERMAQALDGRIWITSGNGGLTMYDPLRDRFWSWEDLTGTADPAKGVPTRAVHCISADSILVGIFGRGTWLYMPESGRSQRIASNVQGPEEAAEMIAPWPGRSNTLFVMAGTKLLELDRRSLRTRPLPLRVAGRPDDPLILRTIVPVYPNRIWVGTWGEGLWSCDPATGDCERYLPDPTPPLTKAKNIISSVLNKGADRMLIGTERGLLHFDPEGERFRTFPYDPTDPHSMPVEGIHDLLLDHEGTVWIAHASGLSKWDPAQDRFVVHKLTNRIETSVPLPRISGVVELDERLMVATAHGDGLLMEEPDGNFRAIPHAGLATEDYAAIQVNELFRSSNGRVIALTGQGLLELADAGGKLEPLQPTVMLQHGQGGVLSVLVDRHGHWWFGRQRTGLVRVDPSTGAVDRISEEGPATRRLASSVWCQGLVEDQDGLIWVNAFEVGIDRVSADRSRVDHFSYKENEWLRTGKIWDVEIDDRNRLWLGTNGRGIVITPARDPGGPGTLQLLGGASGVPAMVSSLYKDREGRIWAGGPSGLYRIDPDTHAAARYDASVGLRGVDFHHTDIRQHPSGRITITAKDGELIVVHPADLDARPGPFGISITDVLVHGTALQPDTALDRLHTIDLQPDQNFVEVGYSAIAFSLRSKVRLAHQLLGIDAVPISTGPSGRAVYTNLPPGKHTFLIIDADATDGADAPLHRITFIVRPHFWQSWWFIGLAVLASLTLVVVVVRWRTNVMHDKERMRTDLQRRLSAMELQALRAQMNPHFLFNSLNSINRYIMENEQDTASEYLTKFSRLMRSVLVNSKEQFVSLKDEMDALRLYIELEALRFTDAFTYSATIELDEDPERVMIPPMLLQPYVENAIWHGLMHRRTAGGRLSIVVRRNGNAMEVVIEDNGIGRKAAMELKSKSATGRRSMGMQITRERLDLVRRMYDMDTGIQILDLYDLHQQPSGTRVTIQLSSNRP